MAQRACACAGDAPNRGAEAWCSVVGRARSSRYYSRVPRALVARWMHGHRSGPRGAETMYIKTKFVTSHAQLVCACAGDAPDGMLGRGVARRFARGELLFAARARCARARPLDGPRGAESWPKLNWSKVKLNWPMSTGRSLTGRSDCEAEEIEDEAIVATGDSDVNLDFGK